MRYFLLLIGITLLSLTAKSQNFNYTFLKDSVAWQELNSQTILNSNNSAWNFSYKIPIGFSFNYLGARFDSVRIETNGYMVFDKDRNYAMTAFLGFSDCVDSTGNHSVLGYSLSGNNGNHILKIQFRNTSNQSQAKKHFTYQIWLQENGGIEVHIGPNDFQRQLIINSDSSRMQSVLTEQMDSLVINRDTIFINYDSMQAYRIGLLNMNMDTETKGLFIGENANAPMSQPVNQNNPEPVYLMRAPSQGTRYTFTPNFN